MKIIQLGNNLSLPRIIVCGDCNCEFEYDKGDVREGLVISQDQSYFYSIAMVYCPFCKVSINVPLECIKT